MPAEYGDDHQNDLKSRGGALGMVFWNFTEYLGASPIHPANSCEPILVGGVEAVHDVKGFIAHLHRDVHDALDTARIELSSRSCGTAASLSTNARITPGPVACLLQYVVDGKLCDCNRVLRRKSGTIHRCQSFGSTLKNCWAHLTSAEMGWLLFARSHYFYTDLQTF